MVALDAVVCETVVPGHGAVLRTSDAPASWWSLCRGCCRGAVMVVGCTWPRSVLGGSIIHEQIVGCCFIAWVLVPPHCVLVREVSEKSAILGGVRAGHESNGKRLVVSPVLSIFFGEVPAVLIFGGDEPVVGSDAAALLGDRDCPRTEVVR
ncbi:hypothetical protein MHU86_23574 [Fragilaria crotonensis]|nr:hypothetical protein MHU86_23574 [Fragilaria crotonensis]